MFDEGDDAPLVTEVVTLAAALIGDLDPQAGVQEGEFAQSPREDVERKLGHRKNFGIRQKGHLGTGFITITDHFERRFGHAALVTLTMFLSAAVDFDRQLDGERIDLLPMGAEDIARCTPIYETLPGWSDSTVGVTEYDKLPASARRYLERIEEVTGVPIDMISTSPDRDHTIMMRHPYVAV